MTDSTEGQSVHRIRDYATPERPQLFHDVIALTPEVELDADDLIAQARTATGLDEFGDESFREPLGVLLDALVAEGMPELHALGKMSVQQMMIGLLSTRLLVHDLLQREPEIADHPIESPMVIVGLPRSGTTHLHNLISADPNMRSMQYWESLRPVLPPDEMPAPGETDPRMETTEMALGFMNEIMPLFKIMHEMTATHVHEEIQLLAATFSTQLFEASFVVPDYRDWYLGTDQTDAYGYMKLLLQIMSVRREPDKRWILKSPQHLEQVGPLMATFPDAKVIRTHRDPVKVTASMCTMVAYGKRSNYVGVDPVETGQYWLDRIEIMLRAVVRDRDLIPADQVIDSDFIGFMDDNIGRTKQLYAFADQPFDDTVHGALEHYLATHPPGRHGKIDYQLSDFGTTDEEIRERFRFYTDAFDVAFG